MTASESAFARLYDELYDEVYAFCARRVGPEDAADVTAEVFATVWRRMDQPIETTPRAWVFGVARKVVLNEWRSRSRRGRLRDKVGGLRNPSGIEPEVVVVRRMQDERVVEALHRLSKQDQEVLMLSAWDDLSPPEMAHVLGVSVAAIHQRLSRARKRLARVVRSTSPDLVFNELGEGEMA